MPTEHITLPALIADVWQGDRNEHLQTCEMCYQRWQRVVAACGAAADHFAALSESDSDFERRYEQIVPLRAAERAAERLLRGFEGHHLVEAIPLVRASRHLWSEALIRRILISIDEFYDRWEPTQTLQAAMLATDMAEEVGNVRLCARSWRELGNAHRECGSFEDASKALDAAQLYAETYGLDSYEIGLVLFARAALAESIDRPYESLHLLDQCTQIFEKHGDTVRVERAGEHRLLVQFKLGNFEAARVGCLRLLESARKAGNEKAAAIHAGNVAACCTRLGEHELARRYFAEASDGYDRLGLRVPRARMIRLLGRMAIRTEGRAGIAVMEEARSEFQKLGMVGEVIRTYLSLIEELVAAADRELVAGYCEAAIRLAQNAGFRGAVATAMAELQQAPALTPDFVRQLHDMVDEGLLIQDFSVLPN